ncbi:MAG: DUF4350 domain-containing protein [Mucilaginibacter sp.]
MKDFKIYVIVASVLLIGYLVAKINEPKPVVWTETYSKDDKIPFGTYILYNNLNDIFPGAHGRTFREPLYNVINDYNINDATYIIINDKVLLSAYDIDKMLPFIKQGNDVFIASNNFSDTLANKLKFSMDGYYFNDSTITDKVHFVNKHIGQKKYKLPKGQYDIYFSQIDTLHAVSLAQNDSGKTTFVKYAIGKGHLYLNCDPKLFTNYSLINTSGSLYTATALSYLRNSKTIIWDEYYTKGRVGERSLMRVFFNNRSLRWAYLIALGGVVIFVIYERKRRQRIIPVIEPLKNSTVEFVNVVGQVYYEQRENQNIAQKKVVYFLEYLRSQYYLKTDLLNREFVERLAQKTGIELSFAQELITQIHFIKDHHVTDNDLIKLNQLIEQFYKQSK